MRRINLAVLALFFIATFMFAAEEGETKDLKTAQVVAVKNYDRGRIVRWEGRVPIFDDYPFFDITLLLDNKKYVVRYESMTGYYPSRWQAGNKIQVRPAGKGRMYLLNGTEEVVVGIFNNKAQQCVFPNSPPITLTVGPQVPCQ